MVQSRSASRISASIRRMSSCTVRPIRRLTSGSSTVLKRNSPLGRQAGSVTLELTATNRRTPCCRMAAVMFAAARE